MVLKIMLSGSKLAEKIVFSKKPNDAYELLKGFHKELKINRNLSKGKRIPLRKRLPGISGHFSKIVHVPH
jgi:hypothetical protein